MLSKLPKLPLPSKVGEDSVEKIFGIKRVNGIEIEISNNAIQNESCKKSLEEAGWNIRKLWDNKDVEKKLKEIYIIFIEQKIIFVQENVRHYSKISKIKTGRQEQRAYFPLRKNRKGNHFKALHRLARSGRFKPFIKLYQNPYPCKG